MAVSTSIDISTRRRAIVGCPLRRHSQFGVDTFRWDVHPELFRKNIVTRYAALQEKSD